MTKQHLHFADIKNQPIKTKAAFAIATWFFSGLSPKAPGTVGSFFTLPLVFLLAPLGFWSILFFAILLFFIGQQATSVVLKVKKATDPGYVVIDETVGQLLTFLWVAQNGLIWYDYFIGFALFRFFDIVKVWPASIIDRKTHNAFGVMADDVIAGLYASFVLYGIHFIL